MAVLGASTRQQNPSSDEDDDTNCSAMLLDLDVLDCPTCCDALTSTIYQCENGHIACSTCCDKLRNKCPYCALPIGHIRCRAMERVIEEYVIVPCPNTKLGCTKSLSYGTESTHEKECNFSLCYVAWKKLKERHKDNIFRIAALEVQNIEIHHKLSSMSQKLSLINDFLREKFPGSFPPDE